VQRAVDAIDNGAFRRSPLDYGEHGRQRLSFASSSGHLVSRSATAFRISTTRRIDGDHCIGDRRKRHLRALLFGVELGLGLLAYSMSVTDPPMRTRCPAASRTVRPRV
jgi:hypothetical protein